MIIKTIDLNYDFMDSFINKELTIIRNSTMNTKFIDDEKIVHFLKKEKTDCILCDISLETSTMNGFSFYEKIYFVVQYVFIPKEKKYQVFKI